MRYCIRLILAGMTVLALSVSGYGDESRLKDLQAKRLETVRSLAELTLAAFKGGTAPASAVHEVKLLVLDIELELCATDAERVAVRRKSLQEARSLEEAVNGLVNAQQLSRRDALKAKLKTLEAEVALELLLAKVEKKPGGSK